MWIIQKNKALSMLRTPTHHTKSPCNHENITINGMYLVNNAFNLFLSATAFMICFYHKQRSWIVIACEHCDWEHSECVSDTVSCYLLLNWCFKYYCSCKMFNLKLMKFNISVMIINFQFSKVRSSYGGYGMRSELVTRWDYNRNPYWIANFNTNHF